MEISNNNQLSEHTYQSCCWLPSFTSSRTILSIYGRWTLLYKDFIMAEAIVPT